jgi:hypothetical protein
MRALLLSLVFLLCVSVVAAAPMFYNAKNAGATFDWVQQKFVFPNDARVIFEKNTCPPWRQCVLGVFHIPNRIVIYNVEEYMDNNMEPMVTDVVCHEIRHMYEYQKYGDKAIKRFMRLQKMKNVPHFYEDYLGKITWTQDKCLKNTPVF